MFSSKYQKLQEDVAELEDGETLLPSQSQQTIDLRSRNLRLFSCTSMTVLALSTLCNVLLLSQVMYLWYKQHGNEAAPLTQYVGLKTDLLLPFDEAEGDLWDPVWNSPQMSDNLGVVALNQDYVKAKNLPSSMRYPWDYQKGVYVLSFHHNIHCLRYLRQSVLEAHTGRDQSMALGHLAHCLNVLREDTMCHADDTPRYTGRMHSQANITRPQAGIGQTRKCRDYNKLYEWSIEHSACYADPDDPDAPAEDYFKSCPDGRKLWE